jgi:sporulation protein YlmC with PRC-barrel domain
MAGAGVKLFTAGSQLTATEVNTYLMDQVVAYFADSAARDAAFGGAGEATLSPGRVCYLFSDNKLYVYDNTSNWVEIGAQVEDGEITTAKIAALAVTTAKIADSAVTSAKIADGTIVNADINASAAIDKTKISGTAITAADTGTVTSTMITNGTIVNADINASAAIALSKLADATAGQVLLGTTTTGVVTATTISGDVTVTGAGVTAISSGVIVNADVNASAAIDKTKISGTAVTLTDTGTITSTMIENDTIINADIKSNAAIAYSKLSLSGSIVNADVNASAAIAYSKLNLATSITNSDIATSAAISLSKLASGTAAQVIVHSGSGVPTATTVTGDVTISSSGVTAISSDTIVNADINASAAIDKTKISGTAITAADTGTVTSTMIADGTIVNADINASAAIELGKLADATIDIKTANYSLILTDKNKFIKMNSSSNRTITVPLQATVDFPEGSQIHLIRYGSGTLEIVGESGAVIIYATPGKFLRAQYSSATLLKCADTNVWMLMGDLSAS